MANVSIRVLLRALTARMRTALNNPAPLMRALGGLMVSQSQRAFDESRMGEYAWPKRYPNMGDGDNFVNIAGIVSDFAQGKEPPKRRFQSRPPLLDTGWMRKTLKDKSKSMRLLEKHVVEVGTTDPRAAKHQWGGSSEQFITDSVRKNLAEWLRGGPSWKRTRSRKIMVNVDLSEWAEYLPGRQSSPIRKFRKTVKETYEPAIREVKTDKQTGYMGTLTRRERFGPRLGFLFKSRVLVTPLNQRPFVGIPDDLRSKMLDTVAEYFSASGGEVTIGQP